MNKTKKQKTIKSISDNILNGMEYNVIQVSMEHLAEDYTDLIKEDLSCAKDTDSVTAYEDAKFSLDVLTNLCLAQSKLNNIYGHWDNSLWPTLRNNIEDWKIQIENLKGDK